ncbi:MAG: hypothetical protein H6559_19035 [Lewinellaceae bacterium]|nr:hypothetical protein [Lewinellaceae bacterium]
MLLFELLLELLFAGFQGFNLLRRLWLGKIIQLMSYRQDGEIARRRKLAGSPG